MVYAQLSGARSLRELEVGFNEHSSQHYHLGTRDVRRSMLSDANTKRDCRLFEQVCLSLLGSVSRQLRKQIKDQLYLLDSIPIPLQGRGYDWAQEKHNHRTKGLKVQMMIEANGQPPVFANIRPANVNDVTIGKTIEPIAGATYVFDKGYCDIQYVVQTALCECVLCYAAQIKCECDDDETAPCQQSCKQSNH